MAETVAVPLGDEPGGGSGASRTGAGFWTLTLGSIGVVYGDIGIVTVKYVLILLRIDNHGEGGTLALMALAQRALGPRGAAVILLGRAVLWRCDHYASAVGPFRG